MVRILFFFVLLSMFYSCSKKEEEKVPDEECDSSLLIENINKVEGYADKQSYFPGDTVQFKIHSTTDSIDIAIYHYGVNKILVNNVNNIASFSQSYNCRSYSYGCDWQTTYSYVIPLGLKSGIYSATVTNNLNEKCYISFIVKNPSLLANDILVLASTNTWQAYNDWNGQSFYKYGLNEEVHNSTIVSFHRPNKGDKPETNTRHLIGAELHLMRWLENKNYLFDVVTDIDLHNDYNLLSNYKVLILNVHPEYWSLQMYNQLIHFLGNGGRLMYLGGNGIYWKVGLAMDRIEVIKSGGMHKYALGIGGQWRDLNMPEAQYLGVGYTSSGIHTNAAYKVLNANHWIFSNTGVANGDLFGEYSLTGGKASGGETDKISFHSPLNIELLAKGENPNNGGANLVYYEKSNGSKVFSVGSMSYTGSLPVDSVVSRITKNVLDDFLN